MTCVILPAVYSELATAEATRAAGLGDLPAGLHPSRHQGETHVALTQGRAPVIFNGALTGDGKSLAGLLPLLTRGDAERNVVALYPTNELLGDQARAVAAIQQQWGLRFPVREVNSRVLDEAVAAAPTGTRGDALLRLFWNADLLLSNPDILHYVMQMFYVRKGRGGDAPDRVLGRILPLFAQVTFDDGSTVTGTFSVPTCAQAEAEDSTCY